MQPLGKNLGSYRGETIDVVAVIRSIESAAVEHGWQVEELHADAEFRRLALRRASHSSALRATRRVYLSAGIHGDEPAGPLAAAHLLAEDRWPENVDLWFCPCLNPPGFATNRRENPSGRDLNRDYRHLTTAEIVAHVRWLERQPQFDVAFCFHEDWESHGFYVYELNPDQQPSLSPVIVAAAAKVCPIDLSPMIEGREARGGIINPSVDPASRPEWPEAFWLLQHKTRLSYTLEAPSDFPLAVRVNALVEAVNAALSRMAERGAN